jgi:hypothetical protein
MRFFEKKGGPLMLPIAYDQGICEDRDETGADCKYD